MYFERYPGLLIVTNVSTICLLSCLDREDTPSFLILSHLILTSVVAIRLTISSLPPSHPIALRKAGTVHPSHPILLWRKAELILNLN